MCLLGLGMRLEIGSEQFSEGFYVLAPWSEELGRRLVWHVVKRKARMLAGYRDIGRDDLISEGLMRAREAHAGYDPSRGKYSTHIENCVGRRFIDLWRSRSRRLVRESKAAKAPVIHAGKQAIEEEDMALAEWVGMIYRAAKLRCGTRAVRRGRRWYSPAQAAACLALRQRLDLSFDSLAVFLADRADVRAAMCMLHRPSARSCKRFLKKIRDIGDKFPGSSPGIE